MPVRWSDQALDDLADITGYIEQFNLRASASLLRKVGAAAQTLSSVPHGFRFGRIPGTREMVIHPNYLLVYRVNGQIRILTVIHARKKYP
ncbi:type II toxin-antitoxin system RelE/ParE family toxin [Pseudomonas iranensis]|uniref:Type II toxin-antitoxin system RelE/ParE family toxin n=1 Tax=Pseudomonas triticicola TaxID=2842345 RepID=A0ABS6RHA7_9PSED|nr:type II toxin-antitoxin system RelE/ParE family toxin [Pseudomonas triticicola]QXI25372.1 type II toxin-antitoxin system RelE/ParE family toxin [Pseudomonas iranensis]